MKSSQNIKQQQIPTVTLSQQQNNKNICSKTIISHNSDHSLSENIIVEPLRKFINFLRFHKIKAQDIWGKDDRLSINQFGDKVFQVLGYHLTTYQLAFINTLSFPDTFIQPSKFAKLGMKEWQSYQNEKIISKKRPKSSKVYRTQNSVGQIRKKYNDKLINQLNHQEKQNKLLAVQSHIDNKSKIQPQLSFQQSRIKSALRKKQKQNELKKGIHMNILEKKWDFILKVGQLNKWLSESEVNIKYKISNSEQTIEIIRQDLITGIQEIIPQRVFLKNYETQSKTFNKRRQNSKTNLKGTVLMVLEQNDKLSKNNLQNRLNQRDQELNYVLLQIMRMRNILQHQYEILQANMINTL